MHQNTLDQSPPAPLTSLKKNTTFPESRIFKFKQLVFFLFLFTSVIFIGYLSTLSILKIEMDVNIDSKMQIFWADEGDSFAESLSSITEVKKGKQVYWTLINNFNKSTRFRIDPVNQKALIKIHAINLYSLFNYPVEFDLFNDIVQTGHIKISNQQSISQHYLELVSTGLDPQIEINPFLLSSPVFFISLLILTAGFYFRKTSPLIPITLITGFIFLYFLLGLNESIISFKAHADQKGKLNIFWRDNNEKFSYTRVKPVIINPGNNDYSFRLKTLNNIEKIKLETGSKIVPVRITEFSIHETGFNANIITKPNFGIINTCLALNDNKPLCNDQITLIKQNDYKNLIVSIALFLSIYLLICWIIFQLSTKRSFYPRVFPNLIKTFFFVALILVANLAWQADYNIHPDEHAHIKSIKYFSQYWDPPAIGDSRSVDTYQYPWGISRLDDLGISYFFAGKFRNLMQLLINDEDFTARAFNVLLFSCLFFLTKNKRVLLFFTPLLCSPQIWYLFSYANRGSFVLFISLLLAWQLVNKNSYLNIFLRTDKPLNQWKKLFFPGLLLGILSIEQTNYLLFILFVFSVLLWELLFFVKLKKVFIIKCLLFLLVGVSVFLIRYSYDVSINGTNKLDQKIAYAELHAAPNFKPSVASTKNSYSGLRLRAKGIGFFEMLEPDWDWHKMSFKSFIGFYGYYAEYSPKWYYAYFLLVIFIMTAVILKHAIFQLRWQYKLFTLLTLTAFFGGVLMSMLFSWLYDFQPQGRYMFPVIPILLVYFWKLFPLWGRQEKALVLASTIILIIFSFYSFNEVALNYLFS